MPDIKAAGAICYLKDGKDTLFLLLRSARHGEWGPPKGKAETGETDLETAARELYEETGLRKLSFHPEFQHVINYKVKNKKGETVGKQVTFFLCEIPAEEIRLSHEHNEVHFATLAEVEVLLTHEDIREVFRNAAAKISA